MVCKHEDQSENLQHPRRKSESGHAPAEVPVLWKMQRKRRVVRVADLTEFSERSCLKGIRCRIMGQDTGSLLTSVNLHMYM